MPPNSSTSSSEPSRLHFSRCFPMTCQGLPASSVPCMTARVRVSRYSGICPACVCACVRAGARVRACSISPISSAQGPWEIQLYGVLRVLYGHIKELSMVSLKSQVLPSPSLTVHSSLLHSFYPVQLFNSLLQLVCLSGKPIVVSSQAVLLVSLVAGKFWLWNEMMSWCFWVSQLSWDDCGFCSFSHCPSWSQSTSARLLGTNLKTC